MFLEVTVSGTDNSAVESKSVINTNHIVSVDPYLNLPTVVSVRFLNGDTKLLKGKFSEVSNVLLGTNPPKR